jgi:hypothetical protein
MLRESRPSYLLERPTLAPVSVGRFSLMGDDASDTSAAAAQGSIKLAQAFMEVAELIGRRISERWGTCDEAESDISSDISGSGPHAYRGTEAPKCHAPNTRLNEAD